MVLKGVFSWNYIELKMIFFKPSRLCFFNKQFIPHFFYCRGMPSYRDCRRNCRASNHRLNLCQGLFIPHLKVWRLKRRNLASN